MSALCIVGIIVHLACGIWVIWKLETAPCGVEIPGIGFVEVDDERDDGD